MVQVLIGLLFPHGKTLLIAAIGDRVNNALKFVVWLLICDHNLTI